MRLPSKRGLATIPRYASGYMHQFSHVYLLQQELLNKTDADWFRALELWHTARHEGIALNVSHYNNILQHCAIESSLVSSSSSLSLSSSGAPWYISLNVLRQMRRDALRADCRTVSLALTVLANNAKWVEAIQTFSYFGGNSSSNDSTELEQQEEEKKQTHKRPASSTSAATLSKLNIGKYSGVGVKMDSVCVGAVIRACLLSSSSSSSLNDDDTNNNEGAKRAEEFVSNLRDSISSKKKSTTMKKRKLQPGENALLTNNNNTTFTTTMMSSVDHSTIDAAINELQAFVVEEEREAKEAAMKNIIEANTNDTATAGLLSETAFVDDVPSSNIVVDEQRVEEQEEVMVFSNHERSVKQWNRFFEQVQKN